MNQTFWTDDQASPFLRPTVNCFDDVNKFLLVLQYPVQFVIISCSKITHHVFISEEEHEGYSIVKFIHLLEIRYLVEVADILIKLLVVLELRIDEILQ